MAHRSFTTRRTDIKQRSGGQRGRARASGALGAAMLAASCGGGGSSFDRRATPPRTSEPRAFAPDAGLLGNLSARLGPVRELAESPPPISGGTLTALRDGRTFVAADPDRDRVWIVDRTRLWVRDVALTHGDEPGRVVEGRDGEVFVALRRGGAVLAVDVARGQVTARHAVCPAPRGIAWDPQREELIIACAGGELATVRHAMLATCRTSPSAPRRGGGVSR